MALAQQIQPFLLGSQRGKIPSSNMSMYVARKGLIATAMLLLVLTSTAVYAKPEQESYRILIVASNLEDVIWAHRVGEALIQLGVNVSVEVLYIGVDYPGAQSARSRLSDAGFLWRYRAILVPDLNKEFTWGGRLSEGEIDTLRLYVERGHLLMMGLNTYIHSWYPVLDELAGASITGLAGGTTDTEVLDIVADGTIYRYNDMFGAMLVYQRGCRAEAYFYAYQQYPAICVNRFGDGLVILTAFNAVEAVASQDNGFEIALLLANVVKDGLESIHPKPLPIGYSTREALTNMFVQPFRALAESFGGGLRGCVAAIAILLATLYAVVLTLSLLCLLPRSLRVTSVKPLTKLAKPGRLEQRVLAVLREAVLADLEELSRGIGVNKARVCRALTFLEARGLVRSAALDGRAMYFLREDEARVALSLNPLYRDVADLVSREPGITVTEIAARLSIPPDAVLRACREMAMLGIVEMRKVLFEYEVYPGAFAELRKPKTGGGGV